MKIETLPRHAQFVLSAFFALEGYHSVEGARARVEQAIVREGLKRERRHWSYDQNREIALFQLRDTLGGQEDMQ